MSAKHLLLLICLFIVSGESLFSQNEPGRLYTEIQSAYENGRKFSFLQIIKPESVSLQRQYQTKYVKANYWKYESNAYQKLHKESPASISLDLIDYHGKAFTVLLVRQYVSGKDSRLLTSDQTRKNEYLPEGFFYRGIIKDLPGSFAAFSFFEDQTIAVLSTPDKGNLVLGKMHHLEGMPENEMPHILYYENELPRHSGFQCGVPDLVSKDLLDSQAANGPDTIYTNRCKVIKVFLECDYRLYTDYNGSTTQVRNYITGLFNVVKTLYYNEFINVEISDIMVWTTQDPFLHTDLASILYHYAGYRQNNFTGNLAQLVTTFPPQQQGGIAFLSTLCQPFNGQAGPHSFAFIYRNYSQLPTYSWSVEVIAHELGHNLGSPHTHACAWGPARNMALDNCQPPENNACAPGPQPVGGGTIMSYCHLTGIGINFSKGFGQEPGDLIRSIIQSRTCLSSQYVPVIESNSKGPFYEGDNIILKARPNHSTYSYDWFHYDYLMPSPKDSILRPSYSGIYRVAISDKCTEYSQADTVVISDFLVNLGCPVIKGFRDSVKVELLMNADQGTLRDTLIVPDSLYLKVPSWGKDVLVELHTKITPMGTSWTRDVVMAYQAPASTGIVNSKYTPNSTEPAGFNSEKTYIRKLGRFNPKGAWYFTTNDIKFDNGIDARVLFTIVISWRKLDSVASCDIALCDGQSKTFDAGIQSAMYTWSTGENTKSITSNKTGPLSVQVMKGARKSSHSVTLYNYQTNYSQSHRVCEGDTVKIGKRNYTKAGNYIDTLKSITGCDSIISSELHFIVKPRTYEDIYLCYGQRLDSLSFYRDTQLIGKFKDITNCDSFHTRRLHIYPELKIQSIATPACPETGGSLEVLVRGGAGTQYSYEWSNGRNTSVIDSLASGLYKIKVVDSAGCMANKDIELRNFDSIGVLPLVLDVSCFGKEDGKIFIDFTSGASPFTINWSTGSNVKDLEDLKAGIYTLFVRDANGCRFRKDIEVQSPDLLFAQIETIGSTGNDGSAKAIVMGGTQPYTYFWSTGESTSEITDLSPGDYWVYVYDKFGCQTRIDFVIQQITSTNEKWIDSAFECYPVPVKDKLYIRNSVNTNRNLKPLSYVIYDVNMRNVQSDKVLFQSEVCTIETGELPAGVYIMELKILNFKPIRKLFVKG